MDWWWVVAGRKREGELSNTVHLCCEIVDWAGHTLVCKSLWKVGPYPGLIFCWLAHDIIEGRQKREEREKSSRVWVPFNSLGIPIKRVLLAWPLFLSTSAISFLRPSIACIHSVPLRPAVRIRNICTTVKLPLFLFCLNNIYTLNLKYFPTNIIHHSPYTHTGRHPLAGLQFRLDNKLIYHHEKYCQKKISSIFKQIKF